MVPAVAPLAATAAQVIGGLAAVAGGGYAGAQAVPAATLPVFATINSEKRLTMG